MASLNSLSTLNSLQALVCVPRPPFFTGEDPVFWIELFENFCELTGVHDRAIQLALVSCYLSGPALIWHRGYGKFQDIEEWKTQAISRFSLGAAEYLARIQDMAGTVKPGSELLEKIDQFRLLSLQFLNAMERTLPHSTNSFEFEQRITLPLFYGILDPNLRESVEKEKPQDLETAIKLAQGQTIKKSEEATSKAKPKAISSSRSSSFSNKTHCIQSKRSNYSEVQYCNKCERTGHSARSCSKSFNIQHLQSHTDFKSQCISTNIGVTKQTVEVTNYNRSEKSHPFDSNQRFKGEEHIDDFNSRQLYSPFKQGTVSNKKVHFDPRLDEKNSLADVRPSVYNPKLELSAPLGSHKQQSLVEQPEVYSGWEMGPSQPPTIIRDGKEFVLAWEKDTQYF